LLQVGARRMEEEEEDDDDDDDAIKIRIFRN
jgi:hypothetical protein